MSSETATGAPLISVVMPAYNAERYIGASITGVLTQTHPNLELVVVDDGSSDRTAAILDSYGDLLRHVRQDNAGSSAARNRGIAEARGEFIALCDSDDVYAPRYLETMLETYRAAGGGRRFVMTNALILTETGVSHGRELIGSSFPPRERHRLAMLQQNFVPYLTLFPREMAEELNGFAPEVSYNEDWDFYLRAILAGWEVHYQRLPLVEYRWTPGSKTTDTELAAAATRQIMERAARAPGLRAEERDYLARVRDGNNPRELDLAANQAVREGRYDDAKDLYRRLLALAPVDRRQRIRAQIMLRAPGALPAWRRRLRRTDTAMGRAEGDSR